MAPTGPVDIRATFGSALIGALVTMILYGVTSLQTYMYFIRYPKDPQWTKNIVSSLWLMDTFHICLVSHAIYHYLVLNYDNPVSLEAGVWSLFLSIGVNVAIAFVTQCFFVHRIHQLSDGKWWITAPILITVIAHFCFGIETMIELFQKEDFSRLSQITYIAALPFAILAVLSDVLITIALCALLYNSRTGFKSTNSMLNLIIVYAINRCLLTSIIAIIEMIMFVTEQQTLWYLAADFVVGKLYANSLLATLNSRSALAGKGMEDEESSEMTNANFHIAGGSLTQSIVFDRQLSPPQRSNSAKKAEVVQNEIVPVDVVGGPLDSKESSGTSSGSKLSKSKRTGMGNATPVTSSTKGSSPKSKQSGSKQSERLVRERSSPPKEASPTSTNGSKQSGGPPEYQPSASSKPAIEPHINKRSGFILDNPPSGSSAVEATPINKEKSASPSNEGTASASGSDNDKRVESEPPKSQASAQSTTRCTFGSNSSRHNSDSIRDHVEVSVRSVAESESSSSSSSKQSAAKASSVGEEQHMIDV